MNQLTDALRYESDATAEIVYALRDTPGIYIEGDETRIAYEVLAVLTARGVRLSMPDPIEREEK